MKATDLMIGDWVLMRGTPVQVRAIGVNTIRFSDMLITEPLENIEPIPLTPEILEKNVTHCIEREYMNFFPIGNKDASTIIVYKRKSKQFVLLDKSLTEVCEIKYVHELQHALKLFGIEKEVVV